MSAPQTERDQPARVPRWEPVYRVPWSQVHPPRLRYERPPDPAELRELRCPRCVEMGRRYGIVWPEVDA